MRKLSLNYDPDRVPPDFKKAENHRVILLLYLIILFLVSINDWYRCQNRRYREFRRFRYGVNLL